MLAVVKGANRAGALGLATVLAVSVGTSALASAAPASAAGSPATTLPGKQVKLDGGSRETVASMMARETALAPRAHRAPASRAPRLVPGRANLPQNPASAGLTATPYPQAAPSAAGPRVATPATAQSVGIQFQGAQLSEAGAVPPDSMGAVGPSQYIVMVNGRLRSFNKTTGVVDGVLNMSTDAFWLNVRNGASTTDPHIRYDRMTGHWFMTMLTIASPSNRLLIAFSDTAVITNATHWTLHYFDVGLSDPGLQFDFDTLGVDANALYVGDMVFSGPTFVGTDGLVIPKATLLGGAPTATEFELAAFGGSCTNGEGPLAPQGVDNFDSSPGLGYFIGVSLCRFGQVDVIRISNPATPTPGATLVAMAVPATMIPQPIDALGNASPLDSLDDRLSAAQVRGGHLWTAHNICVDTLGNASVEGLTCAPGSRVGSRWYDINNLGGTPVLSQVGTVFDPTVSAPRNYWIPSVNISGQLHVAMGTTVAGTTEHAEAATMGRLFGDPVGAMSPTVVYQTSTFAYNLGVNPPNVAQRWGDYSYTSVDPSDDMTMWTIQEFTNATDSWGVEAVKLLAPPPATPTTATVNAPAGQCNESIEITGTSSNGSGFFDPGAGFTNHIRASVSGGVTVSHVTYLDPTHIVLHVSTPAVSAGAKNVTITNPDGQRVTVNGLMITVLPASATAVTSDSVVGTQQYELQKSDGVNWTEMDPALRISCSPSAIQATLLSVNADLWTRDAGFDQDIGIFVSDNGSLDQLLAWKESGGFAGTFSPNAAYAQHLFHMSAGHFYVFKVKWKTNKAALGATIEAGAGPIDGQFSPTTFVAKTFPTGMTPQFFSDTTIQDTLIGSDGVTWRALDDPTLATTLLPGSDSTAVLGANVDLWTRDAGYNQDIGIFVSDNGAAAELVAWKESGGFAGTFSPNAAFVKATWPMLGAHTYRFSLKWKTNKNAPGATIKAGAGPINTQFSPTSLYAETVPSGLNPYSRVSTQQYALPNSDGATWVDPDPSKDLTVAPGADTNAILGANADLWTRDAGYNQDIGIFVNADGTGDQLLAWKESGGFAGTFSPNAAFAQGTFLMTATHSYVFKLKWKANKDAPGATIQSGAGPITGQFSPTRLSVELTS